MKNKQNTSENYSQRFGLRVTKTREALFEILEVANKPLSVPELLAFFAKKGITTNKTTLYRELEHLVQKDILSSVQLSSERVSYEMNNHHHHHFVCESCDSVTKLEFSENFVQKIEKVLASEGNSVVRHTFEFFGVCKQCNYI